jgi:hypothetical protein
MRWKRTLVAAAAVLLLGGTAAFGAAQFAAFTTEQSSPSSVRTTAVDVSASTPRLVFRNTATGAGYGFVATVPLSDPAGPRSVSPAECDRIDAASTANLCLTIDRGVVTTFTATLFDDNWQPVRTWPLPGVPSRTRFSPDGSKAAFSAFITGESYATVGFSIATVVWSSASDDTVNLEDFALTVNGQAVTSADRNFWGVTFGRDPDTFYATAASGGQTWLVRGDVTDRTLVAVRGNAECPSLSPDGTRIAYKTRTAGSPPGHWAVAVLDLATNRETVLPEKRSVDDQVEWLDDSTVLYALPRTDTVGDSDVWAVDSAGRTEPARLVEHAWSPAVVRP